MSKAVHLGFEVGSGRPVEIPVRHMVVVGQTQESGKTTTLEALIHRSGLPAIAFLTKRGEASLEGRRILPYFRDRGDWQFVQSILESTMRERMKFERAWIVRACKGTHSLAEVLANVARLETESKNALSRDVYMLLGEYLKRVVPLIANLPKADRVEIGDDLAVMDLIEYPEELQMLVVASTLEWVHKHCSGVITIVPEAWKFIPESRNTPVKVTAEKLAREGAGLKNYIWIDSQDLAGVWKLLLRGCAVWLIGVQREANELKRAIANMPEGMKRPRAGDVATLDVGQFFCCHRQELRKVYVQPAWATEGQARAVATGQTSVSGIPRPQKEAANVDYKQLWQEEKDRADRMERRVAVLENAQRAQPTEPKAEAHTPAASTAPLPAATNGHTSTGHAREFTPQESFDNERFYQAIKQRLIEEVPQILSVLKLKPEIEVTVHREKLEMDTEGLDGRIAVLIAEGFFDTRRGNKDTLNELAQRGWPDAAPNVSKAFSRLVRMGFLLIESNGQYKAVAGMKVNVVETGQTHAL